MTNYIKYDSIQVDYCDEDLLYNYAWHVAKGEDYLRSYSVVNGKKTTVRLHRLIGERMGFDSPMLIKHLDDDVLNNRRNNLEITTQHKVYKNNKLGLKGIYYNKKSYLAKITVNSKQIHIGSYLTARDAVLAYNDAVVKYLGDSGRLNPVPPLPPII